MFERKNPYGSLTYSGGSVLVKRALLLVIYCLCGPLAAISQQPAGSSVRPFPVSGEVLYLVTDKTVYTPGEVLWFAGYLLPGSARPDSLAADMLSVALLAPGSPGYAVRKNYFIGQGLCSGSLLLPDTIPPGTYQLIAGTNVTGAGRPLQYFSTVVTVKAVAKPPFATEFTINDTLSRDTVFITAQAVLADGRYVNGNGNTISTRLPHQPAKTEKLSYSGYARLAIPVAELEKSGYLLQTVTTCDKKPSHFTLQLPRRKGTAVQVRFYPQGGNLAAGAHQKIWWTAHASDNRPVAVTGKLLENGNAIQALQTGEWGTGSFILAPKPGNRYSLQIDGPGAKQPFPLPEPGLDGPVMDMAAALPGSDTLSVSVRAKGPAGVKIALAALNDTAPQVSDILQIQGERDLKIPIGPLPRGLHSFSLLNGQDSVLAKQLFFAHFNGNGGPQISTNKPAFAPREEVQVTVRLKDARGNHLGGIFTAYCVLEDRIDPDRKQHIDTYYYLDHWLTGGQGAFPPRFYSDKAWLEQRLAVTDVARLQPVAIARPVEKAVIKGRVLRSDKGKIKDALNVMIYRESTLNLVKTGATGDFAPGAADLAVSEGNPVWIKVLQQGGKSQQQADGYAVEITDPMQLPMQALAMLPPQVSWHTAGKQSAMQEILKDSLRQITLKTVDVKGRSVILSDAAYGNKCGDFVCEGGVLNCDHNSGGKNITIPVEGRSYRVRISNPPYYSSVVYRGCTEDNIAPVYIGRRFEGMDSVKLASPERAALSTIFWEPFIVTGKEGDAEFRFVTSDLPGRYKIIVEGIDTNGEVFYREIFIDVEARR